ncbi:helix-turn-helix domain-containing protein [Floridanema evergladense]|uniref:Helix-turn-helix domain-containing protein n=1 Tax=Floridaenema evergladense BLCC-F167 TaxID=3153639 RepID=A0ABV4WSY1_9CYAN
MSTKAERLAAFIKELRGSSSQRRFCQQLGVSKSCVNFWESGLAWPDTENLEKLATLKGWSLADLQTYLVKGELPSEEPLEQILSKVRTLPTEAVVEIVAVAVQTLAARTGSGNEQSNVA